MKANATDKILSIDIGGSKIKASVLNYKGEEITEYKKVKTPSYASPQEVIHAIKELIKDFGDYDRISVGFPGYVKNGVVYTGHNLGPELWQSIPFAKLLEEELGKPTRLLNDADMQGLGVAEGKGFEIVVTFGTGFGTAILKDGKLLPHLELAHHPIKKNKDYDDYIGKKAFKKHGIVKWNKRVQKVLGILQTVFHYDHLYIGGGNSKEINFSLEKNMSIVSNEDGIKGGAKLWHY